MWQCNFENKGEIFNIWRRDATAKITWQRNMLLSYFPKWITTVFLVECGAWHLYRPAGLVLPTEIYKSVQRGVSTRIKARSHWSLEDIIRLL